MLLYSLKFMWWNVGLSPASKQAKSKSTDLSYRVLLDNINSIIDMYNVDFIALGEVSNQDVLFLEKNIDYNKFSILDLTQQVGKTRFDVCVIFKHTKIIVKFEDQIKATLQGQTIKAGQSVKVVNLDDESSIIVYLCHWASRNRDENREKRIKSADTISFYAREKTMKDHDVIIMGDFNDNPFDESIYDRLNATRCTERVKKYPKELFYNPFWRYLMSSTPYSHHQLCTKYLSGTYRFSHIKGNWHLFDQILVSGSLLGGSNWHLDESETFVLNSNQFSELLEKKPLIFDHFPVICQLVRP